MKKKEHFFNDPPMPEDTERITRFRSNEESLIDLIRANPELLSVFVRDYVRSEKKITRATMGITIIINAILIYFTVIMLPEVQIIDIVKSLMFCGVILIVLSVCEPYIRGI